ncbi:MAG TPA: hypothetical protein ENJ53_00755 [Phaeodactylibacter sp.]|nr:hypothetical protein [Phaeodactylibacter sp.]
MNGFYPWADKESTQKTDLKTLTSMTLGCSPNVTGIRIFFSGYSPTDKIRYCLSLKYSYFEDIIYTIQIPQL